MQLTLYREYRALFKKTNGTQLSTDVQQLLKDSPLLNGLIGLRLGFICLIDNRASKYLYVSPNYLQTTGYPAQQFYEGGVEFALSIIHPEDCVVVVRDVYPIIFNFLRSVDPGTHPDYRFAFNYRGIRADGKPFCVLQQSTVLESDASGRPLLTLIISTDITQFKSDDQIKLTVCRFGTSKEDERVLYQRMPGSAEHNFSRRELEVLRLILQGINSKTIAEKLFVSLHTVNKHRSNILKKSGTTNTADLLRYGFAKGLL